MNTMESTVTRNLLKHAAGQTMFCPVCEVVLDWRRTAIVSIGPNERACCTPCLDRAKAELGDKFNNPAIKVIDGRDFK